MEMNEKCSVVVANVPNELSPLFTGEQAVGLDSCTAHAVAVESSFSLATVQWIEKRPIYCLLSHPPQGNVFCT